MENSESSARGFVDKQQKKKEMQHLVGGSNIFFSFSVWFECNFQNQNFCLIFLSIPNTKHNLFTIHCKMREHQSTVEDYLLS